MNEKSEELVESERVIGLCQVFHQGLTNLRGLFDFMEHKNTDKTGYCDTEILTFCNLGRSLANDTEAKMSEITNGMELDAKRDLSD